MFKGKHSKEFQLSGISLPPEVEEGNVEYKLKLLNKTQERLDQLTSQLKWRLQEGDGEAIYIIGVSDQGDYVGLTEEDMAESLETLMEMGKELNTECTMVAKKQITDSLAVCQFKFSQLDTSKFEEVKIAVLGGQDAGKSSLISTFCFNEVDDGKGKARLNMLRHRHEIESGRTSSLARQIIGFKANNELINYSSSHITSWEHIGQNAAKLITFMDTCGHPKYEKTTIAGLTGDRPEYACVVLSASCGNVPQITKEQILLTNLLAIPTFIIITKIDTATTSDFAATLGDLMLTLKEPEFAARPIVIQNEDQLNSIVEPIVNRKVIPLFLTSAVTLENRNLLIQLFRSLPKPKIARQSLNSNFTFQIQEVFEIEQLGWVVGGSACCGKLELTGQKSELCFLGPDRGKYIPVRIHSLQRQRCSVKTILAGQSGSCAINFPVKLHSPLSKLSLIDLANSVDEWSENKPESFRIRRGQVIVAANTEPTSYFEFQANVFVHSHPSHLNIGQDVKIYCGTVVQLAKVTEIGNSSNSPNRSNADSMEVSELKHHLKSYSGKKRRRSTENGLSPGSHGLVTFAFVNESEFLSIGSTIIARGEGIKCIGKITALRKKFN